MSTVSRLAVVGGWVATAGGCAAVTGLDRISEEDCAPLCSDAEDVPGDGPADHATVADVHPTENPGDAADSPEEGSAPGDVSSDTDAPFDSGCGPLNTATNCSACTDTCAAVQTVETSATCRGDATGLGATCSYTCASGYQDCNAASVPNLDGCECHVPGATQAQCCLGTQTCPVAHDNGLNQASSTFFDCQEAGQFSLALATDACAAFTGDAGQCTEEVCQFADGSADGDLVVCSAGSATDCVCWTYQGTNAGTLHDPRTPPAAGCSCADRSTGDPSYE